MGNKVLNKKGRDIYEWDFVKLTNGMIVCILGFETGYDELNENTKILLYTSPVSSRTSYCYPEHIVELIEPCGCFENAMDYFFKNKLFNQPLSIELNRK